MWFKLFVLLRIPISVLCLVGYGQAIRGDAPGIDLFAAAINTALFVFLAVVSVKLVRFRPGALRWARWLLALELVGVALLFVGSDYFRPRAENWLAFVKWGVVTVGLFALLWTLPNARVLRSQWVRFLPPGAQ